MKSTLRLARGKFSSWKHDYKILAALLLNLAFCIIHSSKYTAYCQVLDLPFHFLEPYVLIGSAVEKFTGIFLGCILLLSDSPFFNACSNYEILRVGANTWTRSRFIYTLLAVVIYNFSSIIFTALISILTFRTSFTNEWSQAMILLAEQNPAFAISAFKLTFPYPGFLDAFGPYSAAIITCLFNSAYCIVITITIFLINVYFQSNIGWVAAISVHIISYIIYMNSFALGIKKSLLECALPAAQFNTGDMLSPLFSINIFLIIILFGFYLSDKISSKLIP